MKINWGTAIVIAFVLFISFIMYFVINMSTNKKYNHDLVTADYYQQELQYQEDINKEENTNAKNYQLALKPTSEGLLLSFPKQTDAKKIKGKVFLYRPSNEQLDFEISISLSNHNLLIPDKRLLDGRWNIKVYWTYNEEEFLFKKKLTY